MTDNEKRKNRRRFLQGTVLSDKMEKTRVVQVRGETKHSKYLKIIRVASKYKAHDEKNVSRKGDVVRMMETRPISKDKRWVIINVIKEANKN